MPSTICILWPMLFYFVIFLILPCDIPFYYSRRLYGRYTYVIDIYGIALWHSIVHYIMPAFITRFHCSSFPMCVLSQILPLSENSVEKLQKNCSSIVTNMGSLYFTAISTNKSKCCVFSWPITKYGSRLLF
jgi:hypothetical protein